MTYDVFNLKKEDIQKYMKIMNLNECNLCHKKDSFTPVYDDNEKIVFMNADFSTYNKSKDEFELISNSFYIPITCTNCGNSNLLSPVVLVQKLNESEV
uniref:Uncharacterized protein n=1 Tax=Aliivibrio wodanis TaxID=80852 RepID=A0A5Q4Z4E3_9GAMM|nr:hypothetical protein AW0309160_01860 [Aliivibrio wodanis]